MDALQAVRRRGLRLAVRRHALLLILGVVGVLVGTRMLAVLPGRVALFTLSAFLLAFVALTVSGARPRVPLAWERWLSPIVGFVCGVLGGLTNVPGTPLVIYFYALGLDKHELVRAIALTFVTYKVVQLAAAAWYGLLTWPLLLASLALTIAALVGFAVGLWLQDTLPDKLFHRLVLAFLVVSALVLLARAARGG